MSDSHHEESVVALQSKAEYENAINLSQHVPAAKIISEMVLDAFHTSKESDQIRELRAAIRQAHDSFDDDKAYELMGELKALKDAEAADLAALEDLSSKFSIGRILSSFKDDPAFQEIVYGLALKVLNQTHQAISNPSGGKGKSARVKKEAEVFSISKDGVSVTLPLRTPRSKPSVDREAFPAHQAFAQTTLDDRLEQVPQDIALPETTVPVAREGRMVRHLAVEPEPAEPAIGEVEVYLLAQPPFGPDAHAVAHDQHPHHQFRIDRGPADGAVKGPQLRPHAPEVEEAIDTPQQVIARDVIVEPELVEQLRRLNLHPHHRRVLLHPHAGRNHVHSARSTAD